jgi:RNA polymerase sigma-70 factor
MQASSVCPSCNGSRPFESEVCPRCGNSASEQDSFLSALPPAIREHIREKTEREWRLATTAQPAICLSFEDFLLKLGQIISKQLPMEFSNELPSKTAQEIQVLLENLKWQELFLTTACANGDAAAWNIFRDQYQCAIRKTALRALGNAAQAEDLAETLATDLFLPHQPSVSKGDNKIGQYHGMGSLEGWIKVVIHRLAIDRFRIPRRSVSLEELEVEPASMAPYVQADRFVQDLDTHKALIMVSRSLSGALARLNTQERLVLNLYYLQDTSLKDIGRWLRVHESTVSRMIDRLRASLRKAVSGQLQKEYGIPKKEISHVIQLAQSHLEIDLKEILAE